LPVITLVLVAYLLLPLFLRSGIYTMPQFLEYRYSV
jgi:SSS family solute:Na+ symporter